MLDEELFSAPTTGKLLLPAVMCDGETQQKLMEEMKRVDPQFYSRSIVSQPRSAFKRHTLETNAWSAEDTL